MKRWLLGLVLIFFMLSDSLMASFPSVVDCSEEDLPIYKEREQSEDRFVSGSSLLGKEVQVVFLLLFLAGVFYLFVLFLKRKGRKDLSQQEVFLPSFRLLGQYPIGRNKKIIVVEIYSQVVLLSETASGLQFLYEVKDQEIKDRILLDFSGSLSAHSQRASLDFLQIWREQLSRLKVSFKPLPRRQERDVKNEEKSQKSSC